MNVHFLFSINCRAVLPPVTRPVNEESHDHCAHCDNETEAGLSDTGTTIY